MFVVGAGRGCAPLAIASRGGEYGFFLFAACTDCCPSVTVMEPWRTTTLPLPSDWVVANAARLGVPDERLHVGWGDHRCLQQLPDAQFDVVVVVHGAGSLYEHEDLPHVFNTIMRITKPGTRHQAHALTHVGGRWPRDRCRAVHLSRSADLDAGR